MKRPRTYTEIKKRTQFSWTLCIAPWPLREPPLVYGAPQARRPPSRGPGGPGLRFVALRAGPSRAQPPQKTYIYDALKHSLLANNVLPKTKQITSENITQTQNNT